MHIPTHDGILLSHKKKSCHCDNVDDLEGIRLSEISQRKTSTAFYLYMQSTKQMNKKQGKRNRVMNTENKQVGCQRGGR